MNKESLSLFETESVPLLKSEPLAYRLAPKTFEEYEGQTHIISNGKPLRTLIDSDQPISLIFWGPPGCGKTALSRIISTKTKAHYIPINAVIAKVTDIRDAIKSAQDQAKIGKRTILFIDEIHRFNKAQQDALLPSVENGTITLIGATTENPFFSVNASLISRTHVFELKPLEEESLKTLLNRALKEPETRHLSGLNEDIKTFLIKQSGGDARRLLNLTEALAATTQTPKDLTKESIETLIQRTGISHNEDAHYDIISALIKSIRASKAEDALYWLARLLKGGEDPRFIARRLIVHASEDIGNADPQALLLATAALDAVSFIGMPEAQITLSQVTTYLANAPKSRDAVNAIGKAMKYIEAGNIHPVPDHLKNK